MKEAGATLKNVEVLDRIGFILDFHKAVSGQMTLEHGLVVEQPNYAAAAMAIVVGLCRHRVGSMMWHLYLPGKLALITTGYKHDEERCSADLRSDFRSYLDARA